MIDINYPEYYCPYCHEGTLRFQYSVVTEQCEVGTYFCPNCMLTSQYNIGSGERLFVYD